MESNAIIEVVGRRGTLCVVGAGLSLFLSLDATPALAVSSCPLGFRPGTVVSMIDGIRGTEWDDASLTTSGGGCLGALLDLDPGGAAATRNISVYTKRYTRVSGASAVTYLGFFFEIPDHTRPGTSGTLPNWERIVLQFDPNLSGGTALENGATALAKDHRIEIKHTWTPSPSDADLLVPFNASTATNGVRLFVSNGSGTGCGGQTWADVTTSTANLPSATLRKNTFGLEGAGYTAEIEVPLALLGSPAGDVGVAFAVLNDFATCTTVGVCDGYGASFPSALPVNNTDNPVRGCMTGGWRSPSTWATGYVGSPPVDVFYSHSPSYYFSEDVDGRRCGVVDNNWYNARPCKVGIRSWLRSSSGVAQTRNVAYYWALRGAGQTQWHFLGMNKAVSVPAGAGSGATPRLQDDSIDKSIHESLSDHPCVRTYILPSSLRPDFDEGRISGGNTGILSDSDLSEMSTKYGLQPQHSAQQNITLQTGAGAVCLDTSCNASLIPLSVPRERMAEREAPPSPSPVPASSVLNWLDSVVTSPAHAADGEGELVAPQETPLSKAIGKQILLSGARMETYGRENVIVQIRAFGYRASSVTTTPRYNFLEEIGAIIKMIPVAVLKEGGAVPLDFELGNPGQAARVMMLTVDMKAPEGVAVPPLNLDTSPHVFKAGETRHVTCSLGEPCGLKCCLEKWLRYILLALFLLIAIIVVIRRRRATP